jgi:hypothetical protein
MKKKKRLILSGLANMMPLGIQFVSVLLMAGLMVTACPMDGGDDGETPSSGPAAVTAFSLGGKVTAPVRGETPDTTAIDEAQYTGAIAWQTADGAAHTGAFAAATVYKAVVTLTAKDGWTFTGVGANSFTYTGATAANATDSGTVTITFPATAAAGEDTVVNAFSLDGMVTAPVKGETPDTTAIDEAQYTGAIAWQTADGAANTDAFAASTVYKAVVTLTAKTGFTFSGVVSDTFTYTGAAVTNAANSGTVTITFPATAAAGADTVVNAFSLDGKVTAPVKGETPDTTAIDEAQYTGSIAWQTEGGAAHTGAFAAATVYKAVVTLTAKTGFTFTGLGANSFTYSGAAVANAADRGAVTITFPATAEEGEDTVVNAFSLDGMVTAPVRGADPDTTAIDGAQYTGSIEWLTADGMGHTGAFAAETEYVAALTLTAKTGFTFSGVVSDTFTYTGAAQVFNYENSGIVFIVFPTTGVSSGLADIDVYFTGPGNDITLDGDIKLSKSDSAYSSITIRVGNGGDYDAFRWLVDGADLAGETGGSVTLNASDYDTGAYRLTVIAKKDGVPYSRDFPFAVMN